ncbi:MAG: sigma-54-dependent Fis family transcriptional regulator [Myxococcales bacterium]
MTHSEPQVKREVPELLLLHEIGQMLDRSLDLRTVLQPVVSAMAEHMGMTAASLGLLSRDGESVVLEATFGLSAEERRRGRFRLGEGVTGAVVQTGEPIVVPRVTEDPRFLFRTRGRQPAGASFVCVPVRSGNEVLGALSAERPAAAAEALEDEVRLLSIIASMIAQAVRLRRSAEEQRRQLEEENALLHEQLKDRFRPSNIIGSSKAMSAVYDLIAQVSPSDATVLLRGESGVGKELVAHAIHYNSPRAAKPFVRVNCAALPQSVLESELFGHEKGAFTGALAQRKGRFELAQGGTIFLDEIGDFTAPTQVALLRVLQEREFERVGGVTTLKANVRIIAATNKDLEALIASGAFREDLYYRLNVFPIHVPPLRERRTDILLLADHFVEKYARANGREVKRISTPAIDMLVNYHWPGNVRELENCIERAVLLTSDGVIHGHHLPPTLQTAEASGTVHKGRLQEALDTLERELLADALKTARGNMTRAAQALDITERIMGLRVRKHGLDPHRFRT